MLYMHDGQNLFYDAEAYGGVTWGIDIVIPRLIDEGLIPSCIVVGAWNDGLKRWVDYLPERPFRTCSNTFQEKTVNQALHGRPVASDAYLRFLITELKPFIDKRYATSPERESTFIMGSSMGGLISLYALCEYPEVFAGAGCLSTHWIALEDGMVSYLETAVPSPGYHKIYFDHGTNGVDALYAPFQQKINDVMERAGFVQNQDVLTRLFPHADHNEQSWRERLHIPLTFLMGSAS